MYDIAIVGAGVVGALTARELSKYNIKIALLEKANDVAMGTSKANSAIVHAGYDSKPGSNKAIFNVQGSKMMQELCQDLSVPYKKTGSLVLAFNDSQMTHLTKLLMSGNKNGVPGLCIIGQDKLRELEPNININALGALYSPTAAITCPYELTIAATEVAVTNGLEFKRNFRLEEVEALPDGSFELKSESESIKAKFIINCAGLYSDEIAALFGDKNYKITARKGEYFLLDKTAGNLVNHVVFQCPTKMGKGVLITPTVHGNIIVGPTAYDIEDKSNVSTTLEGSAEIMRKARRSLPNLNQREMITSFSGLRAHLESDDFILEYSSKHPNVINVLGIESPGLAAAPALAKHLENMVLQSKANLGDLSIKENYARKRKAPVRFNTLDNEQRRKLIEKNKLYAQIVCRCESVTYGEIIDAIRAPAGARDVDGVKRRTRAGMGRCQGGFCGSKVAEILADELNLDITEVTKFGGESNILLNKTKKQKSVSACD
ncbi:MAG: NAD(P)/FAD-dependent oxidoreductase [Clostridiales bacterium]|nr:NAD(P)/FAD-dependent oxidoreductase [Clostridiales bacterium]